ncbi:hypothetical protein PHAMO_270051 [Magnetospirillum molischianum DSM 120]|uniref:Uncharacterized protein n=1 Tax=Magnetospirillum molischianum DSM 120 TaxID=1150626 RepID=H8FS72_MAGML|nr:hypothetical protein PHAMO_270051 [Magnetospirillum molischianum DSM 120]
MTRLREGGLSPPPPLPGSTGQARLYPGQSGFQEKERSCRPWGSVPLEIRKSGTPWQQCRDGGQARAARGSPASHTLSCVTYVLPAAGCGRQKGVSHGANALIYIEMVVALARKPFRYNIWPSVPPKFRRHVENSDQLAA